MSNYEIHILSEDNGVVQHTCVGFKSIDLAVSHLLSAMDCGYTVTFKPKSQNENEN